MWPRLAHFRALWEGGRAKHERDSATEIEREVHHEALTLQGKDGYVGFRFGKFLQPKVLRIVGGATTVQIEFVEDSAGKLKGTTAEFAKRGQGAFTRSDGIYFCKLEPAAKPQEALEAWKAKYEQAKAKVGVVQTTFSRVAYKLKGRRKVKGGVHMAMEMINSGNGLGDTWKSFKMSNHAEAVLAFLKKHCDVDGREVAKEEFKRTQALLMTDVQFFVKIEDKAPTFKFYDLTMKRNVDPNVTWLIGKL